MIDTSSPEALFGEDALKDKKSLRKAYAALIKRYRPDSAPEIFEAIHRCYEEAMAWLKTGGGPQRVVVSDPEPSFQPPPSTAAPDLRERALEALDKLWAQLGDKIGPAQLEEARRLRSEFGEVPEIWLATLGIEEAAKGDVEALLLEGLDDRAARDTLVDAVLEAATTSPRRFLDWMTPKVLRKAAETGYLGELIHLWWSTLLAHGAPREISRGLGAAREALVYAPSLKAIEPVMMLDAVERFFWAHKGKLLDKWFDEVREMRLDHEGLERRHDQLLWLLEQWEESEELWEDEPLRVMFTSLETFWETDDSEIDTAWARHLLELRRRDVDFEKSLERFRAKAPNLYRIYDSVREQMWDEPPPKHEEIMRTLASLDFRTSGSNLNVVATASYLPTIALSLVGGLAGGVFGALGGLVLGWFVAAPIQRAMNRKLYEEILRPGLLRLMRGSGLLVHELCFHIHEGRFDTLGEFLPIIEDDDQLEVDGASAQTLIGAWSD